MVKNKICPFIGFSDEGTNLNCLEERCAIWSEYHDACALQTLNEIPRKLWSLLVMLSKACNIEVKE